MAYEFVLKKQLVLRTTLVPCAHLCRYCCISSKGEHQLAQISVERFLALADRFAQWGKTADYSVVRIMHNSDEITADMVPFLDDQSVGSSAGARSANKSFNIKLPAVRTGGLRMRSDEAIQAWIASWRKTGADLVHASFAGHGEVHDWWNNRTGDYDFLMRIQKMAVEMGLKIGHTFFLMKNTLPGLQAVLDDLDRLNVKPDHRYPIPVAYLGRACSNAAERERLTEEDRDNFAHLDIAMELGFDRQRWKSEREWLRELKDGKDPSTQEGLCLRINEHNIEQLEATPCEATVEALLRRTAAAYHALPSREELMAEYGDAKSTRVYGDAHELDRLWLDRHIRKCDPPFERGLTHLR